MLGTIEEAEMTIHFFHCFANFFMSDRGRQ